MLHVGMVKFNSFKEVCCAIGILDDNEEWEKVLNESLSSMSSRQARELFALMLLFCEIPNPLELFFKFFDFWVDDLRREDPNLSRRILQFHALRELVGELQLRARCLEDFNLPNVTEHELEELNIATDQVIASRSAIFREETDFNHEELRSFVSQCQSSHPGGLYYSQRVFFQKAAGSISCGTQFLAFIDARGGTGKTYLLNAILAFARSSKNFITPAIGVATSGIAATQLSNGRTFHSRFRAPLDVMKHSILDISVQTQLAELIRESVVIVWDEAPMANRFLLEALDRSLRDIMLCEKPFGGKSLVLAEDFRHCWKETFIFSVNDFGT